MTEKAKRFNTDKPKLSFNDLSIEVNAGEARVWGYGATKYARGNWLKGCPYTEAADSLKRHLVAFLNGKDLDLNEKGEVDEKHSGLPHVDHIICSAKILAHSYHTRKDLDDRDSNIVTVTIPNSCYKVKPNTIKLTGAEVVSGLSRQRHAEGLIKQLPNTHDGRNSWLLNYGIGIEAQSLRDEKNIKWDDKTNAAETSYSDKESKS